MVFNILKNKFILFTQKYSKHFYYYNFIYYFWFAVRWILSWIVIYPYCLQSKRISWKMSLYFVTGMNWLCLGFLLFLHQEAHRTDSSLSLHYYLLFFEGILPYQLLVRIPVWWFILNFPLIRIRLCYLALLVLRKHLNIHLLHFLIHFITLTLSGKLELKVELVIQF